MLREILGWGLLVLSAASFVAARVLQHRHRAGAGKVPPCPLPPIWGAQRATWQPSAPLPGSVTYTRQVAEKDAIRYFLCEGCTSEVVPLNDLPLDPIAVTSVRYRAAIACGAMEKVN